MININKIYPNLDKIKEIMSEYNYIWREDLLGFEEIDNECALIHIDLINELIELNKKIKSNN